MNLLSWAILIIFATVYFVLDPRIKAKKALNQPAAAEKIILWILAILAILLLILQVIGTF